MRGVRQDIRTALFYDVPLEQKVPQDHRLWSIDRFVDLGSIATDDAVHAARTRKFSSPPPPKTSANRPRSFPHRSKRAKPDQKGARAPSSAPPSAPATHCFYKESLLFDYSLRM